MKTSKFWLAVWGYIVELVAAIAILAAIIAVTGTEPVSSVIQISGGRVASHFGAVMFTASLAMVWTFYAKSDGELADWLNQMGAFTVYASAFMASVAIYGVLVFALILAISTNVLWIDLFAAWLTVLGILNVYTLLRNVFDLMRLSVEFKRRNSPRNK